MKIEVIAVFPELVKEVFNYGVIGRALNRGLITITYHDLRCYGEGKRKDIDDSPYGGGAGMVLRYSPIVNCIRKIKSKDNTGSKTKVLCASAGGQRLTQAMVQEFAAYKSLILLSGRYEGIDERVIENEVDNEFSIGDYILSGGELALMVLIDSMARLMPGVLNDSKSTQDESFSNGLLEYPHYTRPESIDDRSVPKPLLSGNHNEIKKWRRHQMLKKTFERRRDMINIKNLSDEDKQYLEKLGYNLGGDT